VNPGFPEKYGFHFFVFAVLHPLSPYVIVLPQRGRRSSANHAAARERASSLRQDDAPDLFAGGKRPARPFHIITRGAAKKRSGRSSFPEGLKTGVGFENAEKTNRR
jgi:hypothetical protein